MPSMISMGVPKKFDPEGMGYDYETAIASGGRPDEVTGHWGSLDPRTGMVLKGKQHETWDLMEQEENRRGSEVVKGRGGRYYSVPQQERNIFGGTFVPSKTLEFIQGTTPYKNVKQLLTDPQQFLSDTAMNIQKHNEALVSGDTDVAMETALSWTPMGVGGLIKPTRAAIMQKEISPILAKSKVDKASQEYANKMFRVLNLDDLARSRPDIAQANEQLKWYSKISDYGQSAEAGKLCPRSEGCQVGLDKIKKTFRDKYTPEIGRAYEMKVMEEGLQMPCLNCYVWSHQVANDTSASAIVRGTAQFEKLHPDVIRTVKNSKLPNGKSKVALRAQSSTDTTPPMIPGIITQMHDLSKIKGASGAYTKEPLRVHVTGPAGEYVNMSISSRTATGSMDINAAKALRQQYPNSSIITVEYNAQDVRRMMKEPFVDHIIPNHTSGTPLVHAQRKMNTLYERMGLSDSIPVEDFTGRPHKILRSQSDRIPSNKMLKSTEQIADWEHWGDMNKYLQVAEKRGLVPRFTEFILPEAYEGQVAALIQTAKETGNVKPLWKFLKQNKSKWDKNYMKLVGPEYGKFGKVKDGYQPINFNKINMDHAEEALQNYKHRGVAPDYNRHMELADETIKEFGGAGMEAERISSIQSPVEKQLMGKLPPEKQIEQVVRDRTVNPLHAAEIELTKGNYESAIKIAEESKAKGKIVEEADGPLTERLVREARKNADILINNARIKLKSLGTPRIQ